MKRKFGKSDRRKPEYEKTFCRKQIAYYRNALNVMFYSLIGGTQNPNGIVQKTIFKERMQHVTLW